MNAARRRSLEQRLASLPVPERPPGLAESIKREIPSGLRLVPPPAPVAPPRDRQLGRLAAALFLAVVGGVLADRVLRGPESPAGPPPAPPPRSAEAAPAAGDEALAATTPMATPPPGALAPSMVATPSTLPVPSLAPPQRKVPEPPMVAPTVADVHIRVVDPQGRPLPGATVTVGEDSDRRVAVTDLSGVVHFPSLQGGTYRLRGELAGFSPAQHTDLAVTAGRGLAVELTLPERVEETTTVTAEAPTDYQSIGASASVRPAGRRAARADRRAASADRRATAPPLPPPASPLPPPASTGGTAEPNDQPYGDMFFQSHGVNPFVDAEEDPLSTFGLEVDTGSYGLARGYLRGDALPPPEAIRVEEFLNAFRYGDPPMEAHRKADFVVRAEGAPSPFAGGDRYRLLRFHLRARAVDPAQRSPAMLTFVIDVSGSMAREDRLELVKRALGLLIDQLRPTDRVALVVYGTNGRVLLPPSGDHQQLREAIAALRPEGATNAEEGLRLAYDLAAQARREGGINRVILCSDGVANVGATGADSILARIGEEARHGIELTTVGFGMGNYNDVLMERLAREGNGRYAYVDELSAAQRVFVDDLSSTLQTVAADAKAQVELDPRVVERWRLLGYENRDIADQRFRDDAVDAGEIGAGHEVTALYEVKLRRRPARHLPLATLRLRYRPMVAGEPGAAVEIAHPLHLGELAPSWEEASPGLRLAAVVAELAEVLKRSYWARGSTLAEVARHAAARLAELPGDERVAELAELAARAARLAAEADADRRPGQGAAPEE